MIIKGLVFPRLLLRGVREANVRREVEPFIGFTMSLLIGTLSLPMAIWLGSRLPAIDPGVSRMVVRWRFTQS